jgi:hypothetical protein
MSPMRALIPCPAMAIRPSRARTTLVVMTLATAIPVATSAGTGEPDTQFWSELDVTAPLTTNTTIIGLGQLRFSESLSNPILTTLGAELSYRTGEWTLGGGYRHKVTPNREGEDINVTQIALLRATWTRRFGRSTLAIRTRFDDTLNAASDPWIGRLRVEYRWATEKLRPISYLFSSDEVFYRFSNSELYRNRFRVGAHLRFGERTTVRVYYQRQDSEDQTPAAINALGAEFEIAFK